MTRLNVPEIILIFTSSPPHFQKFCSLYVYDEEKNPAECKISQKTCLKFHGRLSSLQYDAIMSCIHSTLTSFTLYLGTATSGCKQV